MIVHRFILVLVIATSACKGGVSANPDPDAAAIGTPPPTHHGYVLDQMRVPATSEQAMTFGLDLDGDAQVDNHFGLALSTLSTMGFATQETITQEVDGGGMITLVDLSTYNFNAASTATVALFEGWDPTPDACNGSADTGCRHHFDGTAIFTALPLPANPPLEGAIASGTFAGGPGKLALKIGFPDAAPFVMNLIGARMQVSLITADAIEQVIIAGAIPENAIDATLLPAMLDSINSLVMRHCSMLSSPPACGCTSGSTGQTLLSLFEQGAPNCEISLGEIKNNSLINSLLAPDVSINGTPALSVGVSATAVRATYVAP